MSETTSAPAPAAPAADSAPAAPPPASQPALTISEAGRLLRQQRQGGQGGQAGQAGQANGEAPAPESTGRKPSPNDAIAAATKAVEAPAPAPATKAAPGGLSAMERALGVPGGPAPEGQAAAPPPTLGGTTVEIDGQHYSQSQLREYVSKASDYTQKTQQLAQERTAFQQQHQQLQAQQQALATVLPYIQPELARLAESLQRAEASQMPDPALAHTDPTSYVQQRAAYDAAVAEQQRLGSLTTLQQQAQARAMEQQVAAANEQLAKEFTFWADPQERLQAQQQIVDWALNKGGFTREELRGLADARHLKIMMKAALFDRWVEGAKTSAPQQQLNAPPRGVPPPPPPTAQLQEAQQRFDEKPDFRSAAALLGAQRAARR